MQGKQEDNWEELKKIVQENICAVCDGELTIRTNPDTGKTEVWCPHHPDHHGYIERQTYTQALRRGAGVPLVIQAAIEKKMMPKDDLGRAMNLLALRFPDSIKDPATAALFIMDCARLALDPLIQPAEAVPVAFKSHKEVEGKRVDMVTVNMIVTEDGWLSMAARGCKEDWGGPPRTMRLEEYLTTLPENKKLSREDIAKLAKEIKRDACKDEDAWYYVAIGRAKSMTEDAVVPGWFTHRDMGKAEKGGLPASHEPGNQARVRAIKKWIRHVYPECRQKMIDLTAEWYQRAEGIKAAQQYIDAEYSFIRLPEGDEKAGAQSGNQGGEGGEDKSTTFSSQKGEIEKISPSAPAAAIQGEGFTIELDWLNDTLKIIHWDEDTARTWAIGNLKVNVKGKLTDWLPLLNREQAERFTRELNERAARQQPGLF